MSQLKDLLVDLGIIVVANDDQTRLLGICYGNYGNLSERDLPAFID